MNFIDEVKIFLRSGNGGNGCVSFLREKFRPNGGPNGGNGGNGGSIIFHSTSSLNTLIHFRYKQHFYAQSGESGKSKNCSGKSRDALILEVPVGTQIITENAENLIYDFDNSDQYFEILSGGKGGCGNSCFKSSINQAPRSSTKGELGSEVCVWLKLKLLSDVGLVGMPNAGKSTFLSCVSAARPKIADYPFTTLVPSLGVVNFQDQEFILADIPGLIEGAHLGHGLGDRFLKHIERCKIIVHLIDCTHKDVLNTYLTVKKEMESYSINLVNKQEIICLNKVEMLNLEELEEKVACISQAFDNKKVHTISSYSNIGINLVLQDILNRLNEF